MALTRLYYVVGGVTLFFLSLAPLIIAVKKKTLTLFCLPPLPHPLKIFFHYLLTFCLFLCYAIYIAKNIVGDRILEGFNSRVFTNQPTKN
jgi:hypothetical protein